MRYIRDIISIFFVAILLLNPASAIFATPLPGMMGAIANQQTESSVTWTANNDILAPYNDEFLYSFPLTSIESNKGGVDLTNTGVSFITDGDWGKTVAYFPGSAYLSATIPSITPKYSAISIWAKQTGTPCDHFFGWQNLMAQRNNSTDKFLCDAYTDKWNTVTSTSTITDNTWYHVLITVDDGEFLRLYVNGIQEDETAITGTVVSTTSIHIGTRITEDLFWKGSLSNVCIWESESRIFANETAIDSFAAALYNSGTGSFYIAP